LKEVAAQDLPDGILGGAIGFREAGRVERVETQRRLRTFCMVGYHSLSSLVILT
jgi:hypothetical protein